MQLKMLQLKMHPKNYATGDKDATEESGSHPRPVEETKTQSPSSEEAQGD